MIDQVFAGVVTASAYPEEVTTQPESELLQVDPSYSKKPRNSEKVREVGEVAGHE
jgi:hypothetical protein